MPTPHDVSGEEPRKIDRTQRKRSEEAVNRSLPLLAAFFSLVGCAIEASACVFDPATLVGLGGAEYLSVFTPGQLRALALLFLKLHAQAVNIAVV